MKGFIFAAGLGTRLKPFTDGSPKALFKVGGKTMLEHALQHLQHYGIGEVIVNVHHFPGQIREFLSEHDNFGMEITLSDESEMLLETGGGLKKVAWFFSADEPFVVRNVDILSDLNLADMIRAHKESAALATLAVRDRKTSRYFLFDDTGSLCGWENLNTDERIVKRAASTLFPKAFSGIQVLSPEIFPLITESGKFTLIDLYLRLAAGGRIKGYSDQDAMWRDIGKTGDHGSSDSGRQGSASGI